MFSFRLFASHYRSGNRPMTDQHSSPSATHLPWFIPQPGQTDALLVVMGVFLVIFVFMFGVLMLRLHHLPEHIAKKEEKIQYQVVAVFGLLAMFTGQHAFWIAGLLLAMIDIPDFTGVLERIARSVERISLKRRPRQSL